MHGRPSALPSPPGSRAACEPAPFENPTLPTTVPTPPQITDSSLFRKEALEHHVRDPEGRGILQVSPPWTWAVTWTVALLVLVTLVFLMAGKVEVTERAPGILKPSGGVRHLQAPAQGTVAELLADCGTAVKAGDPVLRLASPQLQGAAMEAEQALRNYGRPFSEVARSQSHLFAQELLAGRERIRRAEQDLRSHRRTEVRSRNRLEASRTLFAQGIIGSLEFQDREEQLDAALRAVTAGEQALVDARRNLLAMEAQRREQIWIQASGAAQARAQRDALDLTLRQTVVTAPVNGIVDGLVLRRGDPVQAGSLLAKVVPVGTPLVALAFLPEKDRGFVKEGDRVALELAQYPPAEFGTLYGRVVRVGTDLAGPIELEEAFGPSPPHGTVPSFRVEIKLEPGQKWGYSNLVLRPGMLAKARFTLRRQRLVTLALAPLRRWLR